MRIPTRKTSRQLDVNRDIAATFIFSYLIENSTILHKIVRINAAPLRELSHLSSRAAAAEIERRGLGKLSYKTIARARVRLGLED